MEPTPIRPMDARAPSSTRKGKAFAGRHRKARIAKFQAAQRKKKRKGRSR